jgi:integrase
VRRRARKGGGPRTTGSSNRPRRRRARPIPQSVGRSRRTRVGTAPSSYLIAFGVNAKQLSVFIGHSSVATTYDLYGHLLPGDEQEAAADLDVLLGGVTGVTLPRALHNDETLDGNRRVS